MKKFLVGALGMTLLIGAGVLYVVQARTGGPAVNARPVVAGRLTLASGNLYVSNLAEGPDQGKLAAASVSDPEGDPLVYKIDQTNLRRIRDLLPQEAERNLPKEADKKL